MDHAEPAHEPAPGPRADATTGPATRTPAVSRLLALQRGAGNAAVAAAVQRAGSGKTTFDDKVAAPALVKGGTFTEFANAWNATEAGANVKSSEVDQDAPDANGNIPTSRVTIHLNTSVAKWDPQTPDPDATIAAKEQAEYKRFQTAMKAHEDGHTALSKTVFKDAHTAYAGKSPTDGQAAFDVIDKSDDTQNNDYDTANDHGRSAPQSTKININFGQVIKVP